ncbi:GNAT family N-acetyltransferase [Paenisporosarcina sp. TG-14]|uniref:GNAT family N-acetyltransferase n=1 Tax=Paenisporosarcina sp. TG-14 TaxID=1231057 RepID=UPI000311FE64|nr:GNAT family protein [Paenisporosarcina sp. TG-14]
MILLQGKKYFLQTLREEDAAILANLVIKNRFYWSIFEPRHQDAYFTAAVQREKILESLHHMKSKREFNFGIYDYKTRELIGHISMYNIKRLPFSSAFIGYSIDEMNVGKGIATEAVQLLVNYGMEVIGLHRIEAYVSPRNGGSIRVLEKVKFQREGLLRQLLFINGKWEDHFIYAVLEDDY